MTEPLSKCCGATVLTQRDKDQPIIQTTTCSACGKPFEALGENGWPDETTGSDDIATLQEVNALRRIHSVADPLKKELDALCHDLGEKLLIPEKATPTVILEAVDRLSNAARWLRRSCRDRLPPGHYAKLEDECRELDAIFSPNVKSSHDERGWTWAKPKVIK
jgi:hypothetical protein